jgi:hypothetical protein
MSFLLDETTIDVLNANATQTIVAEKITAITNFAKEIRQINFNISPDFGTEGSASILQGGTLLSDLFLEVTLPPLAIGNSNGGIYHTDGTNYIPTPTSYLNWVNAIGFALIDYVSIEINGQTIDKHPGVWLDVLNELSDKEHKEWESVKKFKDHKKLKYVNFEKTAVVIPLKFFFCNNEAQSLPISELNPDSVKLKVKFNSLNKLINHSSNPSITGSGSVSSVKLFGEFITLGVDETSRLKRSNKNYIIPVIQYIEDVGSGGGSTYNIQPNSLNITGAVKEFIWVFRHDSRKSISNPEICLTNDSTKGNDHFNYSNTHIHETFGKFEMFDKCTIKIRNTDLISENSLYFGVKSRVKHHRSNTNKNIYLYSFATKPENYQPSGHHNFSIKNDTISFNFTSVPGHSKSTFNNGESGTSAAGSDYSLSLFAVTYKQLSISNLQASFGEIPHLSSVQTGSK